MAELLSEDGWRIWDMSATGTWPGVWPPVYFRSADERRMDIRIDAPERAGNLLGAVHGGFLAGVAEHVAGVFLFARQMQSVTVSLALDYPAAAATGTPLTGAVDLIRETGRMQFVRIELGQGGEVAVHGIATLRKLSV